MGAFLSEGCHFNWAPQPFGGEVAPNCPPWIRHCVKERVPRWVTLSCDTSYIGQRNAIWNERCIQQFLNRKYGVTRQRDSPAEPSPSPKYIALQLLYLGSVSNNIRQELSGFMTFTTPRSLAVTTIGGCCRFLNLHCFKNTNLSWMQTSRR